MQKIVFIIKEIFKTTLPKIHQNKVIHKEGVFCINHNKKRDKNQSTNVFFIDKRAETRRGFYIIPAKNHKQ